MKTIQNKARQDALVETSEHLEQTMPLIEITLNEKTLEIYSSLPDVEKSVVQYQPEIIQVVDDAFEHA